MSLKQVNLTLLQRLVKELEAALIYTAQFEDDSDYTTYMVEVSKTMGIALGISTEASALLADITTSAAKSVSPNKSAADLISGILGPKKGKILQ